MSQKLVTFYQNVLASTNVEADENGILSMVMRDSDGTEEKIPFRIGERRLMLPTHQNLRNSDWASWMIFHPLSEHLHRGESMVFKKLRTALTVRASTVFCDLLLQLAQLTANKDAHEDIPPKAAAVLSAMPDADEKTVKAVEKLIDACSFEGANKMLSFHTRRGGKLGASEYNRVTFFSVPLLDHLKEDNTVFGVKLRKKDQAELAKLVEYIFPNLELPVTYSRGSRCSIAPNFDSLLRSYAAVMGRLNEVVKIQRKQLAHRDQLVTDLDWLEELDKLSEYDGLVPAQEGNIGDSPTEKDEVGKNAAPAPTLSGTQAAPANAPVVADGVTESSGPRPITMEELRRRVEQERQPQAGNVAAGWGGVVPSGAPAQSSAAARGWGSAAGQSSYSMYGQAPASHAAGAPMSAADRLRQMMQQNGMVQTAEYAGTASYRGQHQPSYGYGRGMDESV